MCISAHFSHIQLLTKCIHGLNEALLLHDHRVPLCLTFVYISEVDDLFGVIVHGCASAILCTESWTIHPTITLE